MDGHDDAFPLPSVKSTLTHLSAQGPFLFLNCEQNPEDGPQPSLEIHQGVWNHTD